MKITNCDLGSRAAVYELTAAFLLGGHYGESKTTLL
jgi:hypothetical protein